MLLHFDDATSLTGARLWRRDKLIILYGLHHTLELQCIAGPDNTSVDMQSKNCTRWELTITPSLASPTRVLASAAYSENIAVGDILSFDFSTATTEMYKYVAGNSAAPGVFQLLGYEGSEDVATVAIQFPVILRTTTVNPMPPDLPTALMNEIQRSADSTTSAANATSSVASDVLSMSSDVSAMSSAVAEDAEATASALSAVTSMHSDTTEQLSSATELMSDAVYAGSAALSYAEAASSYYDSTSSCAAQAADAASAALDAASMTDADADAAATYANAASASMDMANEYKSAAMSYAMDAMDSEDAVSSMSHAVESMSLDALTTYSAVASLGSSIQSMGSDIMSAGSSIASEAEELDSLVSEVDAVAMSAAGLVDDAVSAADRASIAATSVVGVVSAASEYAASAEASADLASAYAQSAYNAESSVEHMSDSVYNTAGLVSLAKSAVMSAQSDVESMSSAVDEAALAVSSMADATAEYADSAMSAMSGAVDAEHVASLYMESTGSMADAAASDAVSAVQSQLDSAVQSTANNASVASSAANVAVINAMSAILMSKGVASISSAVESMIPDIPTVGSATITITQGGVSKGSINVNATEDSTIDLDAGGGTGRAEWGHISGVLSSQIDLQSALDEKQDVIDSEHKLPYSNISGTPDIPTALSQLSQDSTHRTVTDAEKTTWDNKSDFSGSYDDLTDKPTIPPEQVQANWNEVDSASKAYILNKPSLDYIPQTARGAANGVAPLDSNSLVPNENLPEMAPLTLHLTAAPTTSTVGVFGQHAIVDSTGKEYTCTAVTTADDVTTYTWCDVINEKGGVFTGDIVVGTTYSVGLRTTGGIYAGYSTGIGGYGGALAVGNGAFALRGEGCTALGSYAYSTKDSQLVTGRANAQLDGARLTGGGVNNANRRNIEELSWDGDHLIMGGRQQEITEIPPATTEYTLKEGQQKHVPLEASTYVLPAIHARCIIVEGRWCRHEDSKDGTGYYGWVTTFSSNPTRWDERVYYTANRYPAAGEMAYGNTALTAGATAISLPPDITHECILTLDFTTVQTYAFADSQGNAIAPLFTPTIAAGDVYEFRCEYSAVQSRWLIYPCKQGAVSDDYVMQAEVGAANGVAGLDANGKVPSAQLPITNPANNSAGAVKVSAYYGSGVTTGGYLRTIDANSTEIDSRQHSYKIICPSNLNYAVTAALTDANKIQLTDVQKVSAQDTLGIPAPLILNAAPTTSTVGVLGQLAVDTTTSKTYHCTAITNTGTEAEPVYEYTWTDDVNAMGGTFVDSVFIGGGYVTKGNKNLLVGESSAQGHNGSNGVRNTLLVGKCNTTKQGPAGDTYPNVTNSLGVGQVQLVGDNCLFVGKYNCTTSYVINSLVFVAGIGISNGKTRNGLELDWNGNLYVEGRYQQSIYTIPAATTEYVLKEGCGMHSPVVASTYTLPAVTQAIYVKNGYWTRSSSNDGTNYYAWVIGNRYRYTASPSPVAGDMSYNNTALTSDAVAIEFIDNRTHECVLDVKFDNVQTLVFQDADGNVIEPQDDIDIQQGDVWRFLCQWNTLLECWCIMPVRLQNKTVLPPVLSISPSSYSVEGNEGSALDDLDLSSNVTVQHPVTGASLSFSSSDLPAGVSISSAGVISGTPTAQGTTTSTITIAYPNATSITCTVVFTIAAPPVTYYYTVSGAQNLQNADTGDITNVNVLGDYYLHSGTHGSTDAIYTNGTFYFQLDPRENAWDIIGSPVSDWSEMPGPMFVGLYQVAASGNTPPTGTWDSSNGSVQLDGVNLMAQASTTATVSAYGA